MKIIDFERFGNTVRFYLGEDTLENWGGDDWNDVPYEHNAGLVYAEYVSGYADLMCDANYIVLEPCCGVHNSSWSKEDMVKRRVPCIVVKKLAEPTNAADALYQRDWDHDVFTKLVTDDDAQLFYFGDEMKPDVVFSEEKSERTDEVFHPDTQCLIELYSEERARAFIIAVDEQTFGLLSAFPGKMLRSFLPTTDPSDEWVNDDEFIAATVENIRNYVEAQQPKGTPVYVKLVTPITLDV